MENSPKPRSSNFELLRIVAMLIIIAGHYAFHGVRHGINPQMATLWLDGPTFNKFFTSFLVNGGGVGNGLFFMLTGYFMFGREYKLRRLVKLLAEAYFYAFFLLLLWAALRFSGLYTFPEVSMISQLLLFINVIIPVSSDQWWFLQTYMVLFLLIPVINGILDKKTPKLFLFILLLVYSFWLLPKIFGFAYGKLQMAIFYYILGAWLKNSHFKINQWLALLGGVVIWGLLTLIDTQNALIPLSSDSKSMALKVVYRILSLNLLCPLEVVCFFAFFKELNLKYNPLINGVASTVLGIYLLHDSTVGRQLIWNKLLHVLDWQYKSIYFPLWAFLSVITVFCLASLFDYLRQILFEKRVLPILHGQIDKLLATCQNK